MKSLSISLFFLLLSPVFTASFAGPDEFRVVIHQASGEEIVLYENSRALVVGVSDYAKGWSRLPHAVRDGSMVAGSLRRRGFTVKTLFNPDGKELKEALSMIESEIGGSEDRLLFYFAGHGETVTGEDGKEYGYIIPVDAPKLAKNRDEFLEKAVSMQSVAALVENSQVRHALFLFDCCFSGSIISSECVSMELTRESLTFPARQFITAGAKDEEVPDVSIFTYCLLHALDNDGDLNGDGYMTATELSTFLSDNVIMRSHNTLHPQYGRIHNPGKDRGDFVFVLQTFEHEAREKHTSDEGDSLYFNHSESETDRSDPVSMIAGIEFAYIPGGYFTMGSPLSEEGRDNDEDPVREVRVKPFYMQTTEVTQRLWKAVMGYNPSEFRAEDHPVERVSWNEVREFIRRLNELDPGRDYRLPSEAEWEYGCRAGSDSRFPWGDDPNYENLDLFSWTQAGFIGRTYPVGQKLPNCWGLFDMHGNVFEWCDDWYHRSYAGAPDDGSAWLSPVRMHRVFRGGGSVLVTWEYNARRCRPAYRGRGRPSSRYYDLGFRLVKSVR